MSEHYLKQKSVFIDEDEDEDEGGSGRNGWDIPEPELYDLHQLIRSQHKGRVEAARKFHEKSAQDPNQTTEFEQDNHPLAAMAYFSGIDNQDETPLPGESTDEEIRNELEYKKRLQLQKQLGLTNSYSPTPKPGF